MRRQHGFAMIEAVLLGLILIVPLIWLLGILSEVHRGALAATSAVREAAVDAARADDLSGATRAVDSAVMRAFADHGLDPTDARVRFSVDPGLVRGGIVEVEIRYPVSVLMVPMIGQIRGPSLWIDARNITRIEPFGSRG
jgi:hypothetical protein